MSKKAEIVTYKNGSKVYSVRVLEADGEIGMYRSMLASQAEREENAIFAALPADKLADLRMIGRRIAHTMIYPALVAASEPVSGFKDWPLTFEQYIHMPEVFLAEWEEKVFAANPHWKPKPPETKADVEEQEKKVPRSSPKS